jgi:hypothetical protein
MNTTHMSENNWLHKILKEMDEQGDSMENLLDHTLSTENMIKEFNSENSWIGVPFTIWTHSRVYFPVTYDGYTWVGSVSRYPDGKPTEHMGC